MNAIKLESLSKASAEMEKANETYIALAVRSTFEIQ